MRVNTLLVRWAGGWTERKDLTSISEVGRIEARLDLGATTSLPEAQRVADGQLDEFARERTQTDIAIYPAGGDVPYDDFTVGDTITVQSVSHRVLGLTVTEDQDTGRPVYTPTLNTDVVLGADERVFQTLRKMVNGTLGGRSKVAQPVVPIAKPLGRAPIPVTEFCETFTSTNGDYLGTIAAQDVSMNGHTQGTPIATTDQDWIYVYAGSDPTKAMRIQSNRLVATNGGYGGAQCQTELATQNQWIEFDWIADNNDGVHTSGISVFMRATAGTDGTSFNFFADQQFVDFDLWYNSPGDPGMFVVGGYWVDAIGGDFNFLTGLTVDAASPVGSHFRCELENKTARIFRDGVLILEETEGVGTDWDGYLAPYGWSGTMCGVVQLGEQGWTIDNFCYGDL